MIIDLLKKKGCEIIFSDKLSGENKEREQLVALFEKLREGDTVVVSKLDRLARSLKDLIDLVSQIHETKTNFKSINDSIDTSSPSGKFFFHVFGAIAEFERDMISQRTIDGLKSARARGRKGGRPSGLSDKALGKAQRVKKLYQEDKLSMEEISKIIGISRSTCYRYLEH
jgi:DNA invertase Pin-like site-specific DNA recombinase